MSVVATDDFNRADNADLGASWAPIADGTVGGDNYTIATNTAKAANGALDACEGYTGASWPTNQWAEATLAGVSASGVGTGEGSAVRTVAGSSSTFDAYRAIGNGSGYDVGVWLNGGYTSLGSGSGTTFANGDRVYLELQNSSFNAKKNTTAGAGGTSFASGTDSSVPAGDAGIAYSSSDPTATIDSWQGGDFSTIVMVAQTYPFAWSQRGG